jgi:hypothetical protein
MVQFLLLSPFSSPCSPLYPVSTYLAPSSCDRNCPPPSQVACKLTLFAPPFTQLSRPSQFPRTPTAQHLTTTTLGLIRSCYAEQYLHGWILYRVQRHIHIHDWILYGVRNICTRLDTVQHIQVLNILQCTDMNIHGCTYTV